MISYGTQLVEKMNTALVLLGIPVPERQPSMQLDILVRFDLLINAINGGGSGGPGGGIPEAPTDGKLYGRKDAVWHEAMQEMNVVSMPNENQHILTPELNTVYLFSNLFTKLTIQSIPVSATKPILMYFTKWVLSTIIFPPGTKFLNEIPLFLGQYNPTEESIYCELSIFNGIVSVSKIV